MRWPNLMGTVPPITLGTKIARRVSGWTRGGCATIEERTHFVVPEGCLRIDSGAHERKMPASRTEQARRANAEIDMAVEMVRPFFINVALAATLFISLMVGQAFGQEKEIRIVGGKHPDSPSTKYLIKLYSDAFKRIGYKFVYHQMPNNRSSVESDKGDIYSGELSRVVNYNSKHPKLIRLSIPHYSVNFLAVSAKLPKLELNGWESLKGKDLKIAYRRGTKIIEDHLPNLAEKENIIATSDTEQGLKLAILERVDVFIEGSVNIAKFFTDEYYRDSNLYFAGVVQKLDIYMFIHENHAELVPKLNSAMEEMQDEGLFEKYRIETRFEKIQMR